MKFKLFLALLLTSVLVSYGVAQSDLSANIMRRVNAANLDLDKAEEQIRTGKSEHAPSKLKTAQAEYDNIFNYYKGSFDQNHPTLVKLKKRMEKITNQLKAGKGQASLTTATTPKVKAPDAKASAMTVKPETQKKVPAANLSANIHRRIDAADRHLVWVNQGAAKGERAMGELNSAKGEYKKIFEYYKGSFDPEHSDIVALKNRIDAAEQAMNEGFAKKNATAPIESNSGAVEDLPTKMGEDLISIAGALRTLENRLETAGKSSNPRSYVYGVNDDLNIALGKFNRFNTTYKGQFDLNHVAYRQVETRIKKGREAISELEARASE